MFRIQNIWRYNIKFSDTSDSNSFENLFCIIIKYKIRAVNVKNKIQNSTSVNIFIFIGR